MGDYQNDLFKSIDLITQSAINKLQVNKTITCRIIDNSNATYGEYLVSDGSTTYTAYYKGDKGDKGYELDEQVYVLVPNGDYNNQLIILGRIVSENSKDFNWISPTENYLNATGPLINIKNEAALIANGDIQKLVLIKKEFSNALSAYDCLGIKANFKSLLNVYDTVSGTYGLEFIIEGHSFNGANNDLVPASVTYTWDTSNMYGNPYNFLTFFSQSLVLDIGQLKEINKITISFFQSGDFYDSEHNLIPSKTQLSNTEIINVPHNLFVNNIELSMGYYLSNYTGESVLLYNYNSSLTYEATNNPEKYMKTRLIHYKGNDIKTGYDNVDDFKQTTTIVNGTTVVQQLYQEIDGKKYFIEQDDESYIRFNWYHYVKDKDVNDALAGSSWEFVGENVFDYAFTPNSSLPQEKYKVIVDIVNVDNYNNTLMQYSDAAKAALLNKYNLKVAEINKWIQSHNNTDSPEYKRLIDERDALDKQYKSWDEDKAAALLNVHKYYESKELVFTNEVDTEYEDALTLRVIDDYGGIYNIYDTLDNTLIDDSQEYVVRKIIPVFKSRIYKANYLDTYDTIDWYYPNTEESMIKLPEPDVEGNYTISKDGLWRIISHSFNPELIKGITDPKEIERIVTDSAAQVFRIKGYFNPFYTNNIIKCVLRRHHDLTYNAEKELIFGMKALNGTKNTLVLSIGDEYENGKVIDSNVSAWTVLSGLTHKIQLKAILYDENTLPIEDAVYNWSIANGPDFVLDNGPNPNIKFIRLRTAGKDTFANYPAGIVLKCSVNVTNSETNTDYTGYLALPLRASRSYKRFVGTSKVVYDETGSNPDYKDHAYAIYDNNNTLVPITNVIVQNRKYEDRDWYPQIKKRGINYYLVPSTMIYSGVDYIGFGVQILGNNNAILWGQPVIVYQDIYSNNILNQWDGSLTVDEANNSIFASMIGAGKKSSDNKFTGVLMGEVGGINANGEKINSRNGLFGYSDGYQTFSLDNTGTATLGRSGRAQLQFDGNKGTIQNASYFEGPENLRIHSNPQGMKLAFDTELSGGNGAYIDIVNFTDSKIGKRASGDFDPSQTYYTDSSCQVVAKSTINAANWNSVDKSNLWASGFQQVGRNSNVPYNANTIYYDSNHNVQRIPLTLDDFNNGTYFVPGAKIATEYKYNTVYYSDPQLTVKAQGPVTRENFNGTVYYYNGAVLATNYDASITYYIDTELTIPATTQLTMSDFIPNKYYEEKYYISSNPIVNINGLDEYNANYKYYNDEFGIISATGAINRENYIPYTYYYYEYLPVQSYDSNKEYYIDEEGSQIATGPICQANYEPDTYYIKKRNGIANVYNDYSEYYTDETYTTIAQGPINNLNWDNRVSYYLNYYPNVTYNDMLNNKYNIFYTLEENNGQLIYSQINAQVVSYDESGVTFKKSGLFANSTVYSYENLYAHVQERAYTYTPGLKYYFDIDGHVEAQGAINELNFDQVTSAGKKIYEIIHQIDDNNEFRSIPYYSTIECISSAQGRIVYDNFNEALANNGGYLYAQQLMLDRNQTCTDGRVYYDVDGGLAEGPLNALNWKKDTYYVGVYELAQAWSSNTTYYLDDKGMQIATCELNENNFTPNTYYYYGHASTTDYYDNITYYLDKNCTQLALVDINEFNFTYNADTPYYYYGGVVADTYNNNIIYYYDEDLTSIATSNITNNMYINNIYYSDIIKRITQSDAYNENCNYYNDSLCSVPAYGNINSDNYIRNRYYILSDAQAQRSQIKLSSQSPYLKIIGADGKLRMDVNDSYTQLSGWIIDEHEIVSNDIHLFSCNQTVSTKVGNRSDGERTDWRILGGVKFGITADGTLYAKDGKFDGIIESIEGHIGGWEITSSELKAGNTSLNKNGTINCSNLIANNSGSIGGWSISSSGLSGGGTTINKNGTIICTNLIANNSGSIGGWSISPSGLSGGGTYINKNGSIVCSNLTATTSGTIGPYKITSSSLSGNGVILSGGYIEVGKTVSNGSNGYVSIAGIKLFGSTVGGTYNLNIGGNVSCGNNSIFAKSMNTTSLTIASQNGMGGYALTYHSLYWTRSTKDRDNHINSMIKKYLKDNKYATKAYVDKKISGKK